MEKNIKKRKTNFELCRLVCILYIIIYHLIIHVPVVYETTLWGRPLRTLCHIGVVVFVMISGYFGIRRKWRRLLELVLTVSFYNILGILVATLCFNQNFEVKSLLSVFFPITKGGYWFITSYVVLYMLAPYINMVFEKLDKREFLILLLVLAIVVWYGGGIWSSNIGNGRGIMAFTFSYSIGYYIHKYHNTDNNLFTYKRASLLYFVVSIIIFAGVAFLPDILSKGLNYLCFGYNELGLYLMSVLFLLIFQNIHINSDLINHGANSVLGIYLCHGNTYISSLIVYPFYYNVVYTNIHNDLLLLITHILYAIVVLVCCILIDQCRQIIFKYIF